MVRTSLLFAAVTLIACGVPLEGEADTELGTSNRELGFAVLKPCVDGRQSLPSGTIVVEGRGRAQCTNGALQPMSFTSFTPPPRPWDCGAGGCTCWGNDDCKELSDSGKCHGNKITCDTANPNSCHCD